MSWNPLKSTRPRLAKPSQIAGRGVVAVAPVGKPLPTIDGYEILEKIAKGGMATVYRARDAQTGATVAIKLLSLEAGANSVLRKRFEQEFQATSHLDHPNIIRPLGHGQAAAGPYLVMEFVEGETLGERIEREGPLPESEAVCLIAQVARALDHAHQQGLIHRDVKPDNILLTADGQARLTDFGLVKQLGEDVDLTRAGQGLGTLNFIAPEQLQNAKGIDRRCDVYALAATLYMAVTGSCPFAARTHAQVIKKKAANELSVPRELMPSLSGQLDRLIRRAMHPDRGQRPATCAEFYHELTARGGTVALDSAAAPRPRPNTTAPRGTVHPTKQPLRPQAVPLSTVSLLRTPRTDADPDGQPLAPAVWHWRLVAAILCGTFLGVAAGFCRWGLFGF
jgi:serine/threonine protein kinase